jgi:hypothetical protein
VCFRFFASLFTPHATAFAKGSISEMFDERVDRCFVSQFLAAQLDMTA